MQGAEMEYIRGDISIGIGQPAKGDNGRYPACLPIGVESIGFILLVRSSIAGNVFSAVN